VCHVQVCVDFFLVNCRSRRDNRVYVCYRSCQVAIIAYQNTIDFNIQIYLIGVQLREGVGSIEFSMALTAKPAPIMVCATTIHE